MYRASLIAACVCLLSCQPPATVAVRPKPPPAKAPTGALGIQQTRWDTAQVRPEKAHFVTALAQTIGRNKPRYLTVQAATGVPWQIVGSIHNMECGLSFRQHLFNGDPLTARTYHVPAGQPKAGSPPFQWEQSAIASLRYDGLDRANWGRTESALWAVEKYNGTGYDQYHPATPTPYLWSWTTLYTRGKYVADGQWSSTAVSEQCGVVPILKGIDIHFSR